MSTDRVLVTGAFGLVGSAVVAALATRGRVVVATDLRTPANTRQAQQLPAGVDVRWADLTSTDEVADLVGSVDPAAIIHLAALIPPFCYRNRKLAQAVNVGATESLVAAASAMAAPPRLVLASSIAVYGPRNPHRDNGLLTADTPVNPGDLYGANKVAAEAAVTSSSLDWVILRLGGVLSAEPMWGIDPDLMRFEAMLPADGRIQTVDVRDVAQAFCAATETAHTREVFLIGGDGSHRVTQAAVGAGVTSAMGLEGGLPACQATPMRIAAGSPPIGWTPSARRISLPSNIIHCQICMAKPARRSDGCVCRCGWQPPSHASCCRSGPPTAGSPAGSRTHGRPSDAPGAIRHP